MKKEINVCENCFHFHQHYGISKGKIFEVYFGHCSFRRIKAISKPDKNSCEHFVFCDKQNNEFLSKQFLYKELLLYLLNLELLSLDETTCADETMKEL